MICTVDLGAVQDNRSSMPEQSLEIAIVMADISGSSALYDDIGDTDALRLVGACLDKLIAIVECEGGNFIRSKGDDVLAIFADPAAALEASRAMLSQAMAGTPLAVHVGATFGHVIRARDDIFGDTVNTAARLSALAKPGELLVSDSFFDRLPEDDRRQLQQLDTITFKGKNAPTRVYTLLEAGTQLRTVIGKADATTDAQQVKREMPEVTVTLRYADRTFTCPDRMTLTIGRAAGNDLVIEQAWISREHAHLKVRRGKVELTDRSSSGTFVSVEPGYEFALKRETVLLAGTGSISPGVPPEAPEAEIIYYEVAPSGAAPDQDP